MVILGSICLFLLLVGVIGVVSNNRGPVKERVCVECKYHCNAICTRPVPNSESDRMVTGIKFITGTRECYWERQSTYEDSCGPTAKHFKHVEEE